MSFLGKIGKLSPESAALEGEPAEVNARLRVAHDKKLRPKRLEAARKVHGWREIEADLVPRLGGRWLVSAGSDRIYIPHRGVVWDADSAVPMADAVELSFTVGDNGELSFYERITQPPTWSEYVQRQAQKELQKSAERPTPEWMKP